MDTCGHFPWMPVSVGMLQGTWSTPLTQHIAETRQNAAWEFKAWMIKKKIVYLSVCLCCNSCAFRWLFYRGFLFSSGLGDLCSHAFFWCNKGTQPINWLNKDRKLPPENSSQAPAPPSPTEAEEQARDQKWPQRDVWELAKCGKDAEETRILSIFFFFPRAEFVNGEIGPAANEMRSTTPKSTDEWALGLWRQSHPVSTNHKSEIQRVGWWWWWWGGCHGVGGERGGSWTQ